jgi:hypothetical protein
MGGSMASGRIRLACRCRGRRGGARSGSCDRRCAAKGGARPDMAPGMLWRASRRAASACGHKRGSTPCVLRGRQGRKQQGPSRSPRGHSRGAATFHGAARARRAPRPAAALGSALLGSALLASSALLDLREAHDLCDRLCRRERAVEHLSDRRENGHAYAVAERQADHHAGRGHALGDLSGEGERGQGGEKCKAGLMR